MTRYAVPPPAVPIGLSLLTTSPQSIGWGFRVGSTSGPASAAWPSANLAIFVPVTLGASERIDAIRAVITNGTAASGNFDVGIYDENWNRVASLGSTAQSGTSVAQLATVSWTLTKGRWYLGLAFDNTTATVAAIGSFAVGSLAALGCAQMASAFPLPATVTPARCAQTILPIFGVSRTAAL